MKIINIQIGGKPHVDGQIDNPEFYYQAMDIINNSAQHLSNTIDDFRNFFSNEKESSFFDINIPIEKVLYLVSSKLKPRVPCGIRGFFYLFLLHRAKT